MPHIIWPQLRVNHVTLTYYYITGLTSKFGFKVPRSFCPLVFYLTSSSLSLTEDEALSPFTYAADD